MTKMHERLKTAWSTHPWFSISTVVGLLTIATIAAPWLNDALGYFETSANAKKIEKDIRREMAWGSVQSVRAEVIALRNRLNDCNIKRDKKEEMTSLEHSACDQYQEEFDEATRRWNSAKDAAMKKSKDK